MIRRLINIILLIVLFAACSDSNEDFNIVDGGDELTLTLRLPGFAVGSRAVDENAINDLRVLFFNADGYISENVVDPQKITGQHPDYQVTLAVPPAASSVELVANYGRTVGGTPSASSVEGLPDKNIVMWGAITVEDLKKASPKIYLLRASAKTTVTCTAADFTISEIIHYGASTSGTLAPETEGMVNIPEGVTAEGERLLAVGTPYYFYETEARKCYILIHGSYRGTEGWYKAAYIPAAGADAGKEVALLRNHHYQFNIAEVNDCGWATKQEAIDAMPDNRMIVDLKDNDEAIYNMIACRDYELGVSKDVVVAANATEAVIDILTSYPAGTYALEYDAMGTPWVNSFIETGVEIVQSDTQSEARHYKVSFTIETNLLSEEDRSFTVSVRSGDLSRTVKVVQEGTDLKRGRRAYIHNLDGNASGQDYFAFIDTELQGATEEAMTLERNNCLHFRVYNNQYYYTIPYKDGDVVNIIEGAGRFSVVREGSNWRVSSSGNDNYALWNGNFTISNSDDNIRLSYDVCHRGLFHKLGGSYQIAGPGESEVRKGWFYYEQVNIIGEDGKTYLILDRNMGASSNRPYSVSSTLYSENSDARGGYFKIAETKFDNTLIEGIAPEGFEVPAAYHLQQLPVNLSNNVDAIPNIAVSDGAFGYITLPIAGYMEGLVHKDEAHTCLWSKSLLSGNQGFSEDSDEYGWWFRYLDLYGERNTLGNTRISTRGGKPRAMTVRCLHGPAVPDGWDIPDPGTNRKRIIVRNAPSNGLWCQWPDSPLENYPKMYQYGLTSVYYDVPVNMSQIKFSHNNKETTVNISVITDWTYVNDNYYMPTPSN